MVWYAVFEGILYPNLDYTNVSICGSHLTFHAQTNLKLATYNQILFRDDWDGPEDVKFINWPENPEPWEKGVRVPEEVVRHSSLKLDVTH